VLSTLRRPNSPPIGLRDKAAVSRRRASALKSPSARHEQKDKAPAFANVDPALVHLSVRSITTRAASGQATRSRRGQSRSAAAAAAPSPAPHDAGEKAEPATDRSV